MVVSIRKTEKLIGIEDKFVSNSERKNIIKCRQYLVASKFILKNETLGHHNVYTKRTGTGEFLQ